MIGIIYYKYVLLEFITMFRAILQKFEFQKFLRVSKFYLHVHDIDSKELAPFQTNRIAYRLPFSLLSLPLSICSST